MRKLCAIVLIAMAALPHAAFAEQPLRPRPLLDAARHEAIRLAQQQEAANSADPWDRLASSKRGSIIRVVFPDGRDAIGSLVRATTDALVLDEMRTGPAGIPTPSMPVSDGAWTLLRSEVSRVEITAPPKHHPVIWGAVIGAAVAVAFGGAAMASGSEATLPLYLGLIGLGAGAGAGIGFTVSLLR
jgi:hypothetical protein